jgi:hypothetical protein|uniref:hypothetical protein n=1 Tax=Cephaloticoccus sp. TaxID=1985742 RepID=UPI00404AE581
MKLTFPWKSALVRRLGGMLCLLCVALPLSGEIPSDNGSVGRLLFDDYYQKPRSDELYGQGVARGGADLRNLSNFYSPDATAIPNGTFVFSRLIADKYQVEISHHPLSAELLEGVSAYMMAYPVPVENGGRADLTERDAELLASFVARGGQLILVGNSISDPNKTGFDFKGLNLIGRQFGVQFQATQTDTISIPIPPDHPWFDGVPDMIFGNGTTLEILPSAEATTEVLLTSHSKRAPGPVAVLATHGKGKVLFFGDAGTFGNAHAFRGDIGQARGLQQLMYALLPDGPAPHYGWQEGMTLRAKVVQEQILSAYPEFMQFFKLPRPDGTEVFSSGMRQIDLAASGGVEADFGSRDFVSAVSRQEGTFDLTIGEGDDRGFAAEWHAGSESLPLKLVPKGRMLSPGVPTGAAVAAWQNVLLNEAIAAPLRAYAKPGERWSADVLTAMPQLQLSLTPHLVLAPTDYTFEGPADYEGRPCYVFTRTTRLEGRDWRPEDLVDPAYAMQFNEQGIQLQAGGELLFARYWISQEDLLPVHTELSVSAAIWWRDPRFPAKYIGTHDSKNYENWETINFNATYGRTLTVDFEIQ